MGAHALGSCAAARDRAVSAMATSYPAHLRPRVGLRSVWSAARHKAATTTASAAAGGSADRSRAPAGTQRRTVAASRPPCPAREVSPKYRGLSPQQLDQAFRAEHPGLLEGLAVAADEVTPASAARLLRRLEAELPPALTDVAASGDCVLVAVAPGLLPLLDHAAECCERSLAAGAAEQAAGTAAAALSMLSCLVFAGGDSSAGYMALATRCKQALKAAYDAGAPIRQQDIVELHSVCARASPFLLLAPYFGHRCACAVDGFISQGWASGELAVRFAEAYAALVERGRLHQVEGKWVRVVDAALVHSLSAAHTGRLLRASSLLPVELRIQLSLHARSHPERDWHAQVLALHSQLQQEQQERQAAAAAAAARRAEAGQLGAGGRGRPRAWRPKRGDRRWEWRRSVALL